MTNNGVSRTLRTAARQARATSRAHRQARAEQRQLTRDLATYTTISEIDDLLGSIQGQDDAAADKIRTIVMSNLRDERHPLRMVS